MAGALARERWGIASDRGVFIKISTPTTMEVRLVTILGKTGLTTSVRDVGLVIILNPVVARTGGVKEATSISPTGSAGSAIGSAAIVSLATLNSLVGPGL